jgi:hypothetical protein
LLPVRESVGESGVIRISLKDHRHRRRRFPVFSWWDSGVSRLVVGFCCLLALGFVEASRRGWLFVPVIFPTGLVFFFFLSLIRTKEGRKEGRKETDDAWHEELYNR